MRSAIKKWTRVPEFWLVLLVLVGSLARLLWLDRDPMGLHQDEAYSAYNAWAVMNYGIDSFGYTRPVYYTVWGSGMSVLYSYLTIPFIALWGISIWTIRLPQAIMGCICIPVMYGLGKEIFNSKWKGLACAALLAINPWHIQQSRVAIDCNLAVPMLLLGLYFLCRYLNGKRKSIWGAALFLGLTLYSYALTWVLVPLLLLIFTVVFLKRICFDRRLVGAMAMLFLMAVPLLLFLAVNLGLIPEIRTAVISIPKLPSIRTNEMVFSLGALKSRFLALVYTLWVQHDDRWWMSNAKVGSYYYISIPFILLGIIYYGKVIIHSIRKKEALPLHFMIAVWFFAGFLLGCSIDTPYFHKINYLHTPIILLGGVGIWWIADTLGRKRDILGKGIIGLFIGVYTICFGAFIYDHVSYPVDYSTYGNNWLSRMNWTGYEKALDLAKEKTDGNIYIQQINYAIVLLHEQIPPTEYLESIDFRGDTQFMLASVLGRYRFDMMPGEEEKDAVIVYIYAAEQELLDQGYQVERADNCYGVAWRE